MNKAVLAKIRQLARSMTTNSAAAPTISPRGQIFWPVGSYRWTYQRIKWLYKNGKLILD